jgi:hypothetical protein
MRGRNLRRGVIVLFVAVDLMAFSAVAATAFGWFDDRGYSKNDGATVTAVHIPSPLVAQDRGAKSSASSSVSAVRAPHFAMPFLSPTSSLPIGEDAPDFWLMRIGKEGVVHLADLSKKKPALVIFSSFT